MPTFGEIGVDEITPDVPTVDTRIGAGRFGSLHRAVVRGVRCAVKTFWPTSDVDDVENFCREVSILSQLRHAHIVQYLGHATPIDGRVLLVMEYLAGGSLWRWIHGRPGRAASGAGGVELGRQSVLQREGGIPVRAQVLPIAQGIASALRFLHESSPPMIHGDLNPTNVVMSAEGYPKLIDFGLARAISLELPSVGLADDRGWTTAVGAARRRSVHSRDRDRDGANAPLPPPQFPGPVYWAPPEAFATDKALTPAADVYSFGMMLWEMLTGDVPFGQHNPLHVLQLIAVDRSRPFIPSHVGDQLSMLLKQCWAPEASQRPSATVINLTMHMLQADLQRRRMSTDST